MTATATAAKFTAEKIDGDWTLVKTDESGRQGIGTFATREEARAAVKAAKQAVDSGAVVLDDAEAAEVAELADAGEEFEWVDQDEEAQVAAELAVEPTVESTPVEPAAEVEAQVAEVAEEGASTEDVIEVVRELNALTKLSPGALAKLIEDEPEVLLAAMDAVRTVMATRTKVRLYASKLAKGQRISLRDAGVVTVSDVVKVAQRKVLVQWTDAAGVTGEREMGSWQWITLA